MPGCASCGIDNRAGAKFCGGCGASLASEVACSGCGATQPVAPRFCDECGAALQPSVSPPSVATATSGVPSPRYQPQRLLGEGARKRVYLATDGMLRRDVALAVFKSEGLEQGALDRARREAEAMARLGDVAKSPEDRFASATEARTALQAITALADDGADDATAALDRLAGGAFFGREQELGELRSSVDDAIAGRGRLVMVGGEAGMGKSRLAAEAERYAALRGALVLWGRSYEDEGAPA